MRFLAVEHELPTRQVTNEEVVAQVRRASAAHLTAAELATVETLMHDLFASAGTRLRYHRAVGESAIDLASRAGRRALATAGLDPLDVDLLLYCGIGRGVIEPASATIYQDLLGLRGATAFDVLDACASWVRALQLAHVLLRTGTYRTIMILNAEFVGREAHRYELRSVEEFAHWHPSVTIGEASTATIVTASDGGVDDFECDFRTWGERRDLCYIPLPNVEGYFDRDIDLECLDVRPMQFVSFGLRLMEFGTRKLIEHYRDRPQFDGFDADLVLSHSASDGMSRYVLDACGIDPSRFRFGHHRWANTISASIPLSMSVAARSGDLTDGDRVLLLTASAGVTTALTKFVYTT